MPLRRFLRQSPVRLLVEHGADVNAADKTGRNSALIEAIKGRHFAVAQY
ncbi:ankyrin repeat domain-containing protein, partial [Mesorhizobium sp. M1C.F.Ca.ET.189.01.1.1]